MFCMVTLELVRIAFNIKVTVAGDILKQKWLSVFNNQIYITNHSRACIPPSIKTDLLPLEFSL